MDQNRKIFTLLFAGVLFFGINKVNAATGISDGFDYPVSKPDATGYYDAQNFGALNNSFGGYHLGEDWNKSCYGNCDSGESVYSVSNGIVRFSKYQGLIWGRVIIIEHTLPNNEKYYSQYGHLNDAGAISEGALINRGDQIGTIRDGIQTSRFYMWAHLHHELRTDSNSLKLLAGQGYSKISKPPGWIDPSDFINSHRPLPKATLTITNIDHDSAKLTWTKPDIKNFKKYEIYRSTEAGGINDPAKRTLVTTIYNPDTLEFTDTGLSPSTEYFYSIFSFDQYDNFSQSDEVSTKTGTGVKNITQNPYNQRYPDITERYVTWDDSRINEVTRRRDPYLYVYDITEDKIKTFDLRIAGSTAPATTSIYKNRVAYQARKSSNPYYGDQNIYYFDIERDGGTGVPVTEAIGNQINPDIYEDLIVWEDESLTGNFNLYYLDLNATDGPRELVTDPYHQMLPKIWQDKVVYTDAIAGQTSSYKIMMIDIFTKEKTVLAENMAYGHPYIDQGKVVWEKGDVIYIYDIATKQTETLTVKDAVTPIVSQGKVVYQANGSIFIYDIETRKTDTIVSGLTWQADYDFKNGFLVYTDHTEYDTIHYAFMDVLMVKVE